MSCSTSWSCAQKTLFAGEGNTPKRLCACPSCLGGVASTFSVCACLPDNEFQESGAWKEWGRLPPPKNRERSRGGVLFGVFPNIEGVLLGKAILFGLLRERLARRSADENEKRRLLLSSLGLLVSVLRCVEVFSGVAVNPVEALDRVGIKSGS